ncbi:M28 family peptidase [Granulosicoccus antarcticus]|uniref:Aminopeptidase n=1 Tax=Granulosicoccus antarcticus IMCC3135 TaxID=1192854 RepID=A0A2Z2NMK8_9GAMM|nr:M28 family peptidase [Granulosicoccus antarcticus]ASJ70968.1 Aminopeptidase [Granulosicoccus antarcticus IMCC3135]
MTNRVRLKSATHVRSASLSTAAALLLASPAFAGVGVDTSALNDAVTAEGVYAHLEVFQQIADDNGGNREASSEGFFASIDYVAREMTLAGYQVSVQLFPYVVFENRTPPELDQIAPVAASYEFNGDEGFATATYSGAGETTAIAEPVDVTVPAAADANSSTSGCEESDFAGFTAGNIALVQRGTCSFFIKAANAEAAGASGVMIFNEGQEGRTDVVGATLGEAGVGIPVIGISHALGASFVETETTLRLKVDAITEERVSGNILADTPIGKPEKTLVVGAHLDSVDVGPGINDNGSGSAALLEIALQMSNLGMLDSEETGVRNRVRFAWWGAEEAGLLGSEYYVYNLEDSQFEQIAANLNFDMVGSPNYARFVYDGDGSASEQAGPEGSAFIEWLFNDYFMDQGLAAAPTAFDGRSDYGPFIENGIPAGGLFTGAEDVKTEEEAAIFGGVAGEAYDACYHDECDTLENINMQGLGEMSDAAAYAINVLAVNDLPTPAAKLLGRKLSVANTAITLDHSGEFLKK